MLITKGRVLSVCRYYNNELVNILATLIVGDNKHAYWMTPTDKKIALVGQDYNCLYYIDFIMCSHMQSIRCLASPSMQCNDKKLLWGSNADPGRIALFDERIARLLFLVFFKA